MDLKQYWHHLIKCFRGFLIIIFDKAQQINA